ncbi:MAG: hypothetical protein JNM12_14400 [Alphaproteobacteria bacterium]|nr:hypothetical protein [Alphaproteobacteria bacterium]
MKRFFLIILIIITAAVIREAIDINLSSAPEYEDKAAWKENSERRSNEKRAAYSSYDAHIITPHKIIVKTYKFPDIPKGIGRIDWADDENLIYFEDDKSIPRSFISVNLKTRQKKKIAQNMTINYCFDSSSGNIAFYDRGVTKPDGEVMVSIVQYGKLGTDLTYVPRTSKNFETARVQEIDCKFYLGYPQPDIFVLRTGDGFVSKENEKFFLNMADGTSRELNLSENAAPFFRYAGFADTYYTTRLLPDKRTEVTLFDHKLQPLSKMTYAAGPWWFDINPNVNPAIGILTKAGLLIFGEHPKIPYKHTLFLAKENAAIVEITSEIDRKNEISLSPDGCKIAWAQHEDEKFSSINVFELCRSSGSP